MAAAGGRSGERLAQCLTERCPLVVYGLRGQNAMPRPGLWTLLAGAVSVEPFSLGRWVATHSPDEYVQMLEELSELVNGQKLKLDLQILNCAGERKGSSETGGELSLELLAEGLAVTAGKGVGEVGAAFGCRPQLVLHLGTLEQAADVYFELQEAISKLASSGKLIVVDATRVALL